MSVNPTPRQILEDGAAIHSAMREWMDSVRETFAYIQALIDAL